MFSFLGRSILGKNLWSKSGRDDERSQGRPSSSRPKPRDTSYKDLPPPPDAASHSQAGGSGYRTTGNDGFRNTEEAGAVTVLRQMQRKLEQRVRELEQELSIVKKDLDMAKQEVQLNRVFGNRADIVSETDIKNKAEQLNDCIFQLASTIADPPESPKSMASRRTPSERTIQFFGDSLVKLVTDLRREPVHALTVISLQACLSHFCHEVLFSEFSSIDDPNRNAMLQRIFDNIRTSQPKVVSARWRSLAHSQDQNLQNQQELCRLLIHRMASLFGFEKKAFESNHGEDFSNLVNVTLDLHKMMYGDYVSGDIEPFYPPPGSPFDPERMEVDDPRGSTQMAIGGPILCTTSIGFARASITRRRHGDQFVDQEDRLMLLKAKVPVNLDG